MKIFAAKLNIKQENYDMPQTACLCDAYGDTMPWKIFLHYIVWSIHQFPSQKQNNTTLFYYYLAEQAVEETVDLLVNLRRHDAKAWL